MSESREFLVLRGTLEGHNGWVTSLATSQAQPNLLVSASRDKTLITWQLTGDEQQYGVPVKSLKGHNHIVEDVFLTADSNYAFSASWDKTVKLWSLATGECTTTFTGHKSDVLSVSFNEGLNQVVTASRDKTVKVWNIQGECLVTLMGHSDWVTSVKAVTLNSTGQSLAVSASADKLVKFWDLQEFQIDSDLIGHNNYINAVAISPDVTLVATGGKDGHVMVWSLAEKEAVVNIDIKDEIFAFAFSPNRYWLVAATASGIQILDLHNNTVVEELKPEFAGYNKAAEPHAISLAWSADGQNLFAGYTDNVIRVWQVMTSN